MPDILLVQPPIGDFYLTAKRTIPYGLASIAAALRHSGYTVAILDALATRRAKSRPLPPEMGHLAPYYGRPDRSPFSLFHQYRHYGLGFERIAHQAAALKPGLVGVSSLFTPYADMAMATARAVKQALPQCPIVVGGHHATAFPEAVMRHRAVDFVIRGEGETAMPQLAEAIFKSTPLDAVPGLVHRNHPEAGKITDFTRRQCSGHKSHTTKIPPPAFVADPAQLPSPALELIDNRFYSRKGRVCAQIMTSRGCPFKCSYCVCGASAWAPYRRRPLAAVLEELETAVTDYQARFIDFEDENLSLDRGWFLKLLTAIKTRYAHLGLELRAMNGLYPPTLDEGLIAAMREAGFRSLNLALVSRDPEQCRRFGRPPMHRAFDRAVHLAARYRLSAVGYIIVGAPDQPPQSALADLLYLAQLPVLAGVSVYYPARPSRDYQRCQQLGLLPESFGLMRSTAMPIAHATSRDQMATLLRLGRLLNFIKSRYNQGRPLPPPRHCTQHRLEPPLPDRGALGDLLLAWFLHDRKIRGVTPQGEIYEHRTCAELTQPFAATVLAGEIVPYFIDH